MGEVQLTRNGSPRHKGMFKPGQSGNPLGRPKEDKTIKELARQHTQNALQTLIEIATNPKAKDTARVQAANAILDRAWGKPTQYTENVNMGMTLQDYLDTLADTIDEEKGMTLQD